MCYAIILDEQLELGRASIGHNIEAKHQSLKRSADMVLEKEHPKAIKISDHVSAEQSADIETMVMVTSPKERVQNLEKQLKEEKARSSKLEKELKVANEQKEEAQFALFDLQAKQDGTAVKGKNEIQKIEAHTRQTLKKAQQTWKVEQDKKYENLRAQYQNKINDARSKFDDRVEKLQEKHNEQIEAKDDACKKKVEEYKAKMAQNDQETKKEKADAAQAKKDSKEEAEKLKRDLREEQKRQIDSWKPEHSKTVKVKDDMIKQKDQKIQELRETRANLTTKLQNTQNRLEETSTQKAELEDSIQEKDAEIEDCKARITEQHQQLVQSTEANQDLINKYDSKLVHEGKRWQQQYDLAQKYANRDMRTQRELFFVRDGLNRATKRVNELEKQYEGGKE